MLEIVRRLPCFVNRIIARAFKEVWRDPSVHARTSYIEPDAAKSLIYVRGFMERLARKLSEKSIRPIKWKKKGGNF